MTAFPSRLFVAIFATGISYADLLRERNGDYVRLAFLPFGSLELEWSKVRLTPELRAAIVRHAAAIQARRGERFEVSSSGQYVVLGEQRPVRHPPHGWSPPPVPVTEPAADRDRPNCARDRRRGAAGD